MSSKTSKLVRRYLKKNLPKKTYQSLKMYSPSKKHPRRTRSWYLPNSTKNKYYLGVSVVSGTVLLFATDKDHTFFYTEDYPELNDKVLRRIVQFLLIKNLKKDRIYKQEQKTNRKIHKYYRLALELNCCYTDATSKFYAVQLQDRTTRSFLSRDQRFDSTDCIFLLFALFRKAFPGNPFNSYSVKLHEDPQISPVTFHSRDHEETLKVIPGHWVVLRKGKVQVFTSEQFKSFDASLT